MPAGAAGAASDGHPSCSWNHPNHHPDRPGKRASGTAFVSSASPARAAACGCVRQALSSSLPALPRSCLTCAAWSLLRDRLTPAPSGGEEPVSVLRSQNPFGNGSQETQDALPCWVRKPSDHFHDFACCSSGQLRNLLEDLSCPACTARLRLTVPSPHQIIHRHAEKAGELGKILGFQRGGRRSQSAYARCVNAQRLGNL